MENNYEIPSVPVNTPDLSDNGLRNLAGWIARYKNLGLVIIETSEYVHELLVNGTLASFEPSLEGLTEIDYDAEESDRYEFDAMIADIVDINGIDWANLHFAFQAGKCMMWIEWCNQSDTDKISPVVNSIFNAIEVKPLSALHLSRNITWNEADAIILAYLEYMKNPNIPPLPK